jgi:putative heme-binding domain-containing protein
MKFVLLALSVATAVHAVTPVDQIKVPPGFKVELLKEAGERDGSWICMAMDGEGRLYISPQGSIPESGFAKDSAWGGLMRATVGEKGVEKWERVPVPVGDAMGMLWAFDSLYVSGQGPEGRGIYRCKDTNGDSIPDEAKLWKAVPGGAGEHGAHALVLGADGKSIYIVHGNSTPLISDVAPDSPYRNWGEDDLLPKLKDPVATFFDKLKSPYGYVLRTDENGSKWELYAGGFRNPYDLDFNADGELFTYDSDMEWDRGLPWYRPTRVLHVIPGGEYGFREGSAKWPDWYPDSLPPVVDIGLGCPTGAKFGTNAKGWPEKYQKAFFICDWTFGRLLAVHMKEKGASYTASNPLKSYTYPKDAEANGDVESFLSGKGLPLTDLEIGKDGSMYLTVGGRGTAAGLYRVRYVGADNTAASAGEKKSSGARNLAEFSRMIVATRLGALAPSDDVRQLEARVEAGMSMFATRDAYSMFSMIISSERGSAELRALGRPLAKDGNMAGIPNEEFFALMNLPKLIARARASQSANQDGLLKELTLLPFSSLADDLKLLKFRVLELSFARHGRPSEEWVKTGLEKLMAQYPAKGSEATKLNRELCQLLVWLSNPALGDDASLGDIGKRDFVGPAPNPGANVHLDRKGAAFHADLGQQIIERTLALMDAAPSQEEQIYYALCLRWAHGWTPQQRERYFRWFHEKAVRYTGGNSFAKFVDKIRADAASRVPEVDRATLSSWLGSMASADPQKSKPQDVKPRAFVKAWTLADLEPALDKLKDRKPDLSRGKQLYVEAQCAQCHLFRDGGGNVGPDLTAVAQRFGRKDILEAILDPNKAVSDQYAMITLTVRKGGGGEDQVSGLIQEETSATITLLIDPLSGRTGNYYTNVVNKREKANVSIMPPALLNTLTAEEVADLLAYVGAK